MQKSILIICRDFLPYNASIGGTLRVLTQAIYYEKKGFDVHILSSRGKVEFGYFGFEDDVKRLKISYLENTLDVFRHEDSCERLVKPNLLQKFKLWVKKIGKELLVDNHHFLINNYINEAEKIILKHKIRNVLTSVPQHSLGLVGLGLKKRLKTEIFWIIDYRDSWNLRKVYQKKTTASKKIAERREKKVLLGCDLFSYVSAPMLPNLERKFKIRLSKKSVLSMNGFSKECVQSTKLEVAEKEFKIGYFGSLSDVPGETYDFSEILKVFSSNNLELDSTKLFLYGPKNLKTTKLADFHKLVDCGICSHQTALNEMQNMDALLIVYNNDEDSEEIITGKFFEYVSVKKPIICLGPLNMEVNKLIEQYNLGLSSTIDSEKIIELLSKIRSFNLDIDFDISIFHRPYQYSKVLPHLR